MFLIAFEFLCFIFYLSSALIRHFCDVEKILEYMTMYRNISIHIAH